MIVQIKGVDTSIRLLIGDICYNFIVTPDVALVTFLPTNCWTYNDTGTPKNSGSI